MKSIDGGKTHLSRTTTMAHVARRYRGFDDGKERAMDAVMLLAVVAAIVALYAVMFVGFYHWSHYAPIFPPDGASGPAITQPLE
jgi:hypothetical protein